MYFSVLVQVGGRLSLRLLGATVYFAHLHPTMKSTPGYRSRLVETKGRSLGTLVLVRTRARLECSDLPKLILTRGKTSESLIQPD